MGTWQSRVVGLGNRLLEQILPNNYTLAKASYHRNLYRRDHQYAEPPLLIFQMGKVGSKTIRSSLRPLGLDRSIYHVHYLTLDRINELEQDRKQYLGTDKEHLLKHVWQYQYLHRQIANGFDGKRWKVITLTREPIGRNIATFFENLEVTPLEPERRYSIKSDYYGFEIVLDVENMDRLAELFFERLNHDTPLTFLDHELNGVFGIDVFASEFPTSKGYKIYRDERTDVLLIRLENLNECARDAFREFLGITEFALINTNVGSDKEYASLYKRFRDSIVLPQTYVDRMYMSEYTRHFYSTEEIAKFRAKWSISGN
jgi:hypothetical protein